QAEDGIRDFHVTGVQTCALPISKVTFIFVNIIVMVFVTTIAVKYDGAYVYMVPLCILPIILKAFFDPRLGLFVHVLTVLLLGFRSEERRVGKDDWLIW